MAKSASKRAGKKMLSTASIKKRAARIQANNGLLKRLSNES